MEKANSCDKKRLLFILSLILLAAAEIFYFRDAIFTDALFGDVGDGRFCNLATEHWFRVLQGKENILDLNMFYNVGKTLAYSDFFAGFAVPYCVIRAAGLNMFKAFKITLMLVHLCGTLGLFYLLRKKMKVGYLLSFVAIFIFSYANMSVSFIHPQMFSVYFVPFFVLLVWKFVEECNGTRGKRMLYALLTIAAFVLIFYTAGYMGYFVAIFFAAFVVVYFILADKHKIFQTIKTWLSKRKIELIVYCVFLAASFIPFLISYLPVYHQFGDRQWSEIANYLPRISNFIGISEYNYLYGQILPISIQVDSTEFDTGFQLATLIVFTVVLVKLFWNRKKDKDSIIYIALGITTFVIIAMLVKLYDDKSLWWIIYKFLPGASSIRAVTRFNLLLCLPMALVTAWGMQKHKYKDNRVKTGICVLLMAGYIWIGDGTMQWDEESQSAFLESVPDKPEDCTALYVSADKNKLNLNGTITQLDAWMLADFFDVNNLNGFSSNYPPDWFVMSDIARPSYQIGAYDWTQNKGIKGVYEYDISAQKWISRDTFPEYNLISNKVQLNNGVYTDNRIYLFAGGSTEGQSMALLPGEYTAEVRGTNLNEADVITVDHGNDDNIQEGQVSEKSDDFIRYDFTIKEETKSFEISVHKNDSVQSSSIQELTVKQISENK